MYRIFIKFRALHGLRWYLDCIRGWLVGAATYVLRLNREYGGCPWHDTAQVLAAF